MRKSQDCLKKGPLYACIKCILTPIFKVLYRYNISGKENIPKDTGFILTCNHLSLIDVVLLVISQKKKVCFMAKSELFQNKIFAKILYTLGAFPVNRGKGDMSAINKAEQILKDGGILGIFLEGTRSKDGELLKPKSGISMIAFKTKSKILPACITPRNGGKIKLFKKTFLSYGNVVTPQEIGLISGNSSEFRNASRNVMSIIRQLREKDLER